MRHEARIPPIARPLVLVRHGATELNLAGLRCGGDLDVPLTELGRQQAVQAALRVRELGYPVGVIVASHLQRTQETALIMSRLLDNIEVVIEPAFAERRLGAWNLKPLAETEAALVSRATPPGGEPDAAFLDRITTAVHHVLMPRLVQQPMLVGSKGIARAFRELLGMGAAKGLSNGELLLLDLATLAGHDMIGCHA